MTAPHGGPFDMATVVDLGETRPVPSPPETEDHEYVAEQVRVTLQVEPALFWEMLDHVARPELHDIFGTELRMFGQAGQRRAATGEGTGHASLGVLRPSKQLRLSYSITRDRREVVRLEVSDCGQLLDLSVTDLRLYTDDGTRPDIERIKTLAAQLAHGERVLLGVGLTRAFAARWTNEPLHWLQVNNLHVESDPTWRLAPRPRPTLLEPPAAEAGSH